MEVATRTSNNLGNNVYQVKNFSVSHLLSTNYLHAQINVLSKIKFSYKARAFVSGRSLEV